jgi:hypothetical protein
MREGIMRRPISGAAAVVSFLALAACGSNALAPPQCATGETNCSGACVNLQTSKDHCGACVQVCALQQTCNAGQCTNCPVGQLQCPSTTPGHTTCTPVLSDNANCGGCGAVCAAPSSCQNGACVAPGLSNCGNAPDGGPAQQKDLQNDPANCGACGNACLSSEVCRAGACTGCPSAACANRCADLASDPRNCGACGNACTGTKACVGGTCAQPVKVTILNPSGTTLVPAVTLQLTARVDSALPMQSVQYVSILSDGGDSAPTSLAFDNSLNPIGVPSSAWDASVPVTTPDAGTLAVIARDIAWRADAGDALLHQDRAQVGPLQPLSAPTTVPTLAATQSGAALAAGSWVPLNSAPITFTATNVGPNIASVQFINRSVSDTYVVGTGNVAAGSAQLTVTPAELTSACTGTAACRVPGQAQIVACPVDVTGQVMPTIACTNSVTFIPGRVPMPAGNAPPVITAQPDGTSPTVWYMVGGATGTTAQLVAASLTATQGAVPGTPIVATPYVRTYLQAAADTSASVLALRGDGTALDRFDCATGGICNRTPYVNTSSTFKLSSVTVATAKTILFTESSTAPAQYVYANNPAPAGGAAPAVATGGYPYTGASSIGTTAYGQSSGAVVFYTQTLTGSPYQLRIAHPNITGGIQTLGPAHAALPIFLQVFPSGEIVWQYLDGAGGSLVQAAYYDGTSVAAKVTSPSAQLGTTPSNSWTLVRPQMLLGVAYDRASVAPTPELIEIDINRAGPPQIAAPSPVSSTVGPLGSNGVRMRNRSLGQFAISDDQLKAIYVTNDPGPLFTLWLLDLATGTAGPLYSTATLDVLDGAPQFVHSAAGTIGPVPGTAPSAALAQVPVVVWGERLAPSVGFIGDLFQPMRLFYVPYKSDNSISTPIAVDRLAYNVTSLPIALVYTFASSAAASLFFLSGSANEADLYAVPLTGSGTSSLVLDRPSGYVFREDKGRFLAQRSDGSTYAGKLQAGTAPGSTLLPIATGGFGGPIQVLASLSSLTTFGFSADGDHAWALSQIDSNNLVGGGQPVLRLVDLGANVHQNIGAHAWELSTGTPGLGQFPAPLPCFLGNGAWSIGYAAFANDLGGPGGSVAALYAALGTNPAHIDLGLPAFPYNPSNVPVCRTSLDGSEAFVALTGSVTLTAGVALTSTGPVATKLGAGFTPFLSQPATFSSFGGLYLDEFDLLNLPHSTSQQFVFKVWGESSAGSGKPFPYVVVASGASAAFVVSRSTDKNAAILLMLQLIGDTTGWIPVEAPLAGKTAPKAPLP